MRIISGMRRGHKLIEFEGDLVRPTTDRVKESIFNMIHTRIPDSTVLDLFCGSGALAFEALSRGAKKAVCIDADKKSIDIIRKNAEKLQFEPLVHILHADAVQYLKTTDRQFDLIFLDPPYNKGFVAPVLKQIVVNNVLSEEGIIMLESDCTDDHSETEGLSIIRQKKYGRTYVTIYIKNV